MNTTQSTPRPRAQLAAAVLSLCLSLWVGFLAQASAVSSKVYEQLFWQLLPCALINLALIAFLWRQKKKALLWIAVVPALVGFVSYIEMTCRVWFGLHII